MEDLVIIDKIKKAIKNAETQIEETMMSGGVDNMEKYKYLLGQAHAYQIILQEISNLLNYNCLLYTSPSPRDRQKSRMPSSA